MGQTQVDTDPPESSFVLDCSSRVLPSPGSASSFYPDLRAHSSSSPLTVTFHTQVQSAYELAAGDVPNAKCASSPRTIRRLQQQIAGGVRGSCAAGVGPVLRSFYQPSQE